MKKASFPAAMEEQSDRTDLPEGWVDIELGDHLYIAGRIGWRGLKAEEYTPSGPILLSVPNLNHGDNVDFSRVNHISVARFAESPEIQVRVGDTLLVKDGAGIGKLGYVAQLPSETTVNSSLLLVRPADELLYSEYVFHYLKGPSLQEIARQRITGSATPHLFQKDIKRFRVHVPPDPEQRRIVSRVQALSKRVDSTYERLAKVPAILRRFRQSVLSAACSGRLTADWRDQIGPIESASELLEKIRRERRSVAGSTRQRTDGTRPGWMLQDERKLPDSWALATINELLHYRRSAGYGVLQPGGNIPNGIPFVRVCDIVNGNVLVDQLKRIDPKIDKQYARTRLQGDEVLVTLVGTIGRTALVPPQAVGANIARAVAMLPLCPHIDPRFVHFALAEPSKNAELWELAREVARKTLNLGLLKAVQIPLPPLQEQKEIADRVAALFNVADSIEKRVTAATARAENLKQAILARAFRGELVPTEAELARREGRSYEPASALLARIRAERKSDSGSSHQRALSFSEEPMTRRTRKRKMK